jgi:hypothetical protein
LEQDLKECLAKSSKGFRINHFTRFSKNAIIVEAEEKRGKKKSGGRATEE